MDCCSHGLASATKRGVGGREAGDENRKSRSGGSGQKIGVQRIEGREWSDNYWLMGAAWQQLDQLRGRGSGLEMSGRVC